jgi:hypothetical protein
VNDNDRRQRQLYACNKAREEIERPRTRWYDQIKRI